MCMSYFSTLCMNIRIFGRYSNVRTMTSCMKRGQTELLLIRCIKNWPWHERILSILFRDRFPFTVKHSPIQQESLTLVYFLVYNIVSLVHSHRLTKLLTMARFVISLQIVDMICQHNGEFVESVPRLRVSWRLWFPVENRHEIRVLEYHPVLPHARFSSLC